MADKSKATESTESGGGSRRESAVKQPDLTLGKAPIERGERTGQSRRFSVPTPTSAAAAAAAEEGDHDAATKKLDEIEPVERIPSILRTMPVRRESSPDRPYALSRESVSPIGYPPEPLN